MRLYTVDTKAAEIEVNLTFDIEFQHEGYFRLWINGKKRRNGTWIYLNPTPEVLPSDIRVDDGNGRCLTIYKPNKHGAMAYGGYDCSGHLGHFFCEYFEGMKDHNQCY
jgi:hypothetical protein